MIIHKDACQPGVVQLMNVPNEKFHKAQRLGKPNFFLQPTEFLGNKDYMPPGAAYWSVKMCHKQLNLPPLTPLKHQTPVFDLRPEQVPIFETMKKVRAGLIQLTTGGGKSVIVAALTYCWGTPTLILVHNKDMVEQFYDTFDQFLGWKIGRLNSDHKDIKPITVTTFHSAKKRQQELIEMGFKALIVDEADMFFTKKSRDFVCLFQGERVFAFTATTKTGSDEFMKKGEVPAIERFYGAKIKRESKHNVLEKIYYKYYTREDYKDKFKIPVRPQDNWVEFRKVLDADEERKGVMLDYVMKNYDDGDRVLVLYDRVADVINFHEQCPEGKKYIVHGKIKKKQREEQKERFLSDGGIMFAQYQTSSRGIDYPECNKVFLLFPIKSETTLIQAVGRAVRFLPGKTATVYDFAEKSLYHQWRKRQAAYAKNYHGIPVTPIEPCQPTLTALK